ncbi:MAG TPA: SCO family protein [Stellaceae bacterium]|jgi:protein SCO1/2
MLAATLSASASEFRTSDITGRGYGDVMPTLIDQDGHARSREDFKGRVTLVLFGFTHCPDLCPTALSNLSDVLDQLGEDRDRVEIAFVTVDPERDTPEVLRDYLSGFGPNFIGLTGEPVAIRKAAKTFKVFFQRVPLPGGDYTMDHSAVIYVVDSQARVRLMFTANRQPEDIAHDILELLRETG